MKYRSKFEERVAEVLNGLKIAYEYEPHKLKYTVPSKDHVYTPDFIIFNKRGKPIYLEVKGYLDALTRKKMIWVKESNPKLDIRFVFMQDNPIMKGSSTYYSDWAKKNGFKYTIGKDLPTKWLKE